MRGGGVPRNRVPTPNAAYVDIAQPRARCLTLATRMAKTYARGVFLDSGASASIMSQGHPKVLGSRSPVDWVPTSGFASCLRRNPDRNLRPHKSALRKPSPRRCLQLLKGSQPGRVKGDEGLLNVCLTRLKFLTPLDPAFASDPWIPKSEHDGFAICSHGCIPGSVILPGRAKASHLDP